MNIKRWIPLLVAAVAIAGCTNTPSADEHAKESQSQLQTAGKEAAAAAKQAGKAVGEAAKSIDAGAGPAAKRAEHEAAPAVRTAASEAEHGLAAAGTALKGAVASAGEGNAEHGKAIFAQNCASCHGVHAQGGAGPRLVGEHARKNFSQTVSWIENPKPPMPKLYPSPLHEQDVKDVAAYVQSL